MLPMELWWIGQVSVLFYNNQDNRACATPIISYYDQSYDIHASVISFMIMELHSVSAVNSVQFGFFKQYFKPLLKCN